MGATTPNGALMKARTLYVLTFLAALWGCAVGPEFGTAEWRHERNARHGPIEHPSKW